MSFFIDIKTNYRPHQKSPYQVFRNYNVKQISPNQYSIEFDDSDLKKVKRIAKKNHFMVLHAYPETSSRSTDYRRTFFRTHKRPSDGKYRCIYCNKRLNDSQIEVDHIYPVRFAKTKAGQRYLKRHKLVSVNDAKNLAASCHYCNQKKSTKRGIWLIRAKLGQYKWYWIARRCFIILLLLILCYFVFCKNANLAAFTKGVTF